MRSRRNKYLRLARAGICVYCRTEKAVEGQRSCEACKIKYKQKNRDKMDYQSFRNYMTELSFLKKQLNETVLKLKKARTSYQNYLQANPYKQEKIGLEKKVEELRKKILEGIPNEF